MTSSSTTAFFFAAFWRFSKINIPITNTITAETILINGQSAANGSEEKNKDSLEEKINRLD